MPQLNPAPWLTIMAIAWLALLMLKPTLTYHPTIQPMQTTMAISPTPWPWTWH